MYYFFFFSFFGVETDFRRLWADVSNSIWFKAKLSLRWKGLKNVKLSLPQKAGKKLNVKRINILKYTK